jgi:hypothetical protein
MVAPKDKQEMAVTTLLLFGVPPALLLAVHCGLTFMLGRRTQVVLSLAGLLGLTLMTTLFWYGAAFPLAYVSAECCIGSPAEQEIRNLYAWTIGLPFSLCYLFPALKDAWGLSFCSTGHDILLPSSLFLLGLIPLGLAKLLPPLTPRRSAQ